MNPTTIVRAIIALWVVPGAHHADAGVLRPFTQEAIGDYHAMASTKKAPRREPGSEGETGKARRKIGSATAGQKPIKLSLLGYAALGYAARGWHVFPLKPGNKTPLEKGGFHNATTDPAKIRAWWTKWPDANIGLWPGPSGLLVVDIDGAKGEASASRLGMLDEAPTLTVRTGREGGGRHLYFALPDQAGHIGNLYPGGKDGGIEIRAHAGYVILPPSLHPSGRSYQFEDKSQAIRLPSDRELSVLLRPGSPNGKQPHPEPSAETIPEGTRNSTLASLIGELLRSAVSEKKIRVIAHAINETKCRPPLEPQEVERIVTSIAQREADGVVEFFNKTFAVVQVGDKARILQEETTGDFTLLPFSEFRALYSNRTVQVGRRTVSQPDHWLNSPRRRQHSCIAFEPGKKHTPEAFNLFRGWAVEPGPGICSLFLVHLRENICSGNEEHFRFVEGWLADLFQHPDRKPDTALALRGKQGTGKSIVGKIVGHLLGRHYAVVASSHRVTGHFNAHLEGKLLLQADEAIWGGDKAAEGALKDLVTGGTIWIERKGVDAIPMPNYLRLLVTSNAHWVIPAGMEERRFCALDVGEGRMQDREFFGAMMHQMETSNGYAALLEHLLHVDLTQVDVTRIPRTAALMEQKVASLSPELAWLLDILTEGILPGDVQGEGLCPTKTLWDAYILHAQKIGTRHRSIEVAVGGVLRKLFPAMRRVRKLGGGHERAYCYELPSLKKCRLAFEQATGQKIDWPKDSAAWLRDDGAF